MSSIYQKLKDGKTKVGGQEKLSRTGDQVPEFLLN